MEKPKVEHVEGLSPTVSIDQKCRSHRKALLLLAPVVRDRKGEYREQLAEFRSKGYVRARIDGEVRVCRPLSKTHARTWRVACLEREEGARMIAPHIELFIDSFLE